MDLHGFRVHPGPRLTGQSKRAQICLQDQRISRLHHPSTDRNRARRPRRRPIAGNPASIRICQQVNYAAPAGVVGDQCGRDSSTQAASRAIAMNLAFPRIHHSEVAFAVHDLARERHGSDRSNWCDRLGSTAGLFHRTEHDLDQSLIAPIDQLAFQLHVVSRKPSDIPVCAMLSRPDQNIA